MGDGRSNGGEYGVLAHLARNARKVLTHRQILQAVSGAEYGEEADYIRIYVRRSRREIEPDQGPPCCLLSEASLGYRMPGPDRGLAVVATDRSDVTCSLSLRPSWGASLVATVTQLCICRSASEI